MPSKESLAVAQKYNQSVNVCFCRTVPQESEKCYYCRALADLLDEAIREPVALLEKGILAMNGRARNAWADDVRKFLAQLREGKT